MKNLGYYYGRATTQEEEDTEGKLVDIKAEDSDDEYSERWNEGDEGKVNTDLTRAELPELPAPTSPVPRQSTAKGRISQFKTGISEYITKSLQASGQSIWFSFRRDFKPMPEDLRCLHTHIRTHNPEGLVAILNQQLYFLVAVYSSRQHAREVINSHSKRTVTTTDGEERKIDVSVWGAKNACDCILVFYNIHMGDSVAEVVARVAEVAGYDMSKIKSKIVDGTGGAARVLLKLPSPFPADKMSEMVGDKKRRVKRESLTKCILCASKEHLGWDCTSPVGETRVN